MAVDLNQYEGSVHSQNGEDGLIERAVEILQIEERTFLEIGTSDGRQNNSTALIKCGWSGVGVDIASEKLKLFKNLLESLGAQNRVRLASGRVSWRSVPKLLEALDDRSPAFLSLDIDGIDYYVAKRLLDSGLRPALICCEYNSFLGSEPLTVDYDENFARYVFDPQFGLYYGASLAAWQYLFAEHGYRFLCVESTGINAFFADSRLPTERATGLPFAYAETYMGKYQMDGDTLTRRLLSDPSLRFVDVTREDVDALAAG